jgi:hypothetical protein
MAGPCSANNQSRITGDAMIMLYEKAIEITNILNSDINDDWVYIVVRDPLDTKQAMIQVYDESGDYLGNFYRF